MPDRLLLLLLMLMMTIMITIIIIMVMVVVRCFVPWVVLRKFIKTNLNFSEAHNFSVHPIHITNLLEIH
jgi:hypothetical protein